MADWKIGLNLGGNRAKALTKKVEMLLPEWQVFVRRANGTSRHFTLTRRHQSILLAGVAVVGLWAATSTTLLTHQPEHLAAKERALEELMAANRAAQHRLAAAEKLVGEVAREVDMVHANVTALAESNAQLTKDGGAKAPLKVAARARIAAEPAYDDAGLTGGPESRAVREQVRRLEASLERLRGATSRAVEHTVAAAGERIGETEKEIARLGLDPNRLVGSEFKRGGQGGPFIPATPENGDPGMGRLMERMGHLSGMKAVMERLPLANPIKGEHDFNSAFGTRRDPLNDRTGIHEGIDLGAPIGTPVNATGAGVVSFAGPKDRYGLTVDISHGNGVTTRYAHLSRIKVKDGQRVTRSTVIGLVGNTGRSTGPHLHYEVRVADNPRDPAKFIRVGANAAEVR